MYPVQKILKAALLTTACDALKIFNLSSSNDFHPSRWTQFYRKVTNHLAGSLQEQIEIAYRHDAINFYNETRSLEGDHRTWHLSIMPERHLFPSLYPSLTIGALLIKDGLPDTCGLIQVFSKQAFTASKGGGSFEDIYRIRARQHTNLLISGQDDNPSKHCLSTGSVLLDSALMCSGKSALWSYPFSHLDSYQKAFIGLLAQESGAIICNEKASSLSMKSLLDPENPSAHLIAGDPNSLKAYFQKPSA